MNKKPIEFGLTESEVLKRLIDLCRMSPLGWGYDISFGTSGSQAPCICVHIDGFEHDNKMYVFPFQGYWDDMYNDAKTLELLRNVRKHLADLHEAYDRVFIQKNPMTDEEYVNDPLPF